MGIEGPQCTTLTFLGYFVSQFSRQGKHLRLEMRLYTLTCRIPERERSARKLRPRKPRNWQKKYQEEKEWEDAHTKTLTAEDINQFKKEMEEEEKTRDARVAAYQ